MEKVTDPRQRYLLRTNKKWFNHYCEYILAGKILHVGNGLGYASALIKEKNQKLICLDVAVQKDTINKEDVVLYSGTNIPYEEGTFDVVLCDYVLHHTRDPAQMITELIRVVKQSGLIIVIEQTYNNTFQRLKLFYSCWKQNRDSRQNVDMYWRSYFSRSSSRTTFRTMNLEILDIISEQRKSSYTEMFVLKKN